MKKNQYTTVENSDEHYTPKWVFDKLGIVFDMDVASPEGGSHVPCKQYFTEAQDGFVQEWKGNIWMNPPFSGATKWADKFMAHGNGIAILPASRSRWAEDVWNSEAGVLMFSRDFKFERPDAPPKKISYQIWMIGLGKHNIEAMRNLGRVR